MSGAVSSIHGGFRRSITTGGLRRLEIRVDGDEYFRIEKDNHVLINSVKDGKNVRINSRNVTQASGDHSGVQIKPNQTAATASITGLEVSPRFASAIDGTNLVGIKCDPVLKGTTGDVAGQVVGVQVNIDFGTSASSRTVTGDVAAFEAFLAVPSSGMTYSALVSVLRVRTVNIRGWDSMINFDDANTGATTATDKTGNTKSNTIKVHIGTSLVHIQLYDDS